MTLGIQTQIFLKFQNSKNVKYLLHRYVSLKCLPLCEEKEKSLQVFVENQ